ncbi:proton-conducting transporter transmembrane domain-containing protein [Thermococcus barophilus]|uniref:Na(+) H(+) antiporter subunit D n=1 Tax=Thermococcus barophilus (strain DSM 11836 / MP) TaxID=391623 RepID=F0LHJ6_THEBM|nr:proton-conducting transporter membrane subunit [Thermococcus barophilus]ADT84323.1 Na(+) H(+) antiporter subunit D [Thermococcus barophilus MP]
MIPLLVACPLLFAFLVSLFDVLGVRDKITRFLFLTGAVSPWIVFFGVRAKIPLDEIVGRYAKTAGIQVSLDYINVYFVLAELILFFAVSIYSIEYFSKHRKNGKIYSLLLLMHAGLLGAFISRDLFNYYIYMEIASVSAFALIAISEEKGAKRAAYKYLILSLTASYLFVFAVGMMYLKTGYLNTELIRGSILPSREIDVAAGIAFSALLLKAGVFPLHSWLPDAHSKAPDPVSALLSGIVVKVPVYGMLLLYLSLPLTKRFLTVLMVVAFASIFFGIVLMIVESNIKKFLAYSTVSQVGYVVLGVSTSNILGSVYYAFAHALIKGALFLSAGALIRAQKSKEIRNLSYRGDAILMLSILMLSLAIGGVSPFVGAYGKSLLLEGMKKPLGYILYIAGIGTLAAFTKLNYYLLKSREHSNICLLQRMPPFLLSLLVLASGVYYGQRIDYMDFVLIVSAVMGFALLRRSGIIEKDIRYRFSKTVGEEINIFMAVFLLFTLFLLLQNF